VQNRRRRATTPRETVAMAELGWIGLVAAIVAAYFAIKVVKFVLKLFLWSAVLFGVYWFAAPLLGLPQPFV
jgi:hypothetical protein